jgi:hypothetical protein
VSALHRQLSAEQERCSQVQQSCNELHQRCMDLGDKFCFEQARRVQAERQREELQQELQQERSRGEDRCNELQQQSTRLQEEHARVQEEQRAAVERAASAEELADTLAEMLAHAQTQGQVQQGDGVARGVGGGEDLEEERGVERRARAPLEEGQWAVMHDRLACAWDAVGVIEDLLSRVSAGCPVAAAAAAAVCVCARARVRVRMRVCVCVVCVCCDPCVCCLYVCMLSVHRVSL